MAAFFFPERNFIVFIEMNPYVPAKTAPGSLLNHGGRLCIADHLPKG